MGVGGGGEGGVCGCEGGHTIRGWGGGGGKGSLQLYRLYKVKRGLPRFLVQNNSSSSVGQSSLCCCRRFVKFPVGAFYVF